MEPLPAILVVDDEEAMRDSCRQTLERSGYRVDTAADGVEGLKRIRCEPYDLVLLDLKMPGLDGLAFLKRMKAECPGLEAIVITGYSSIESAVECMRLGAYDYLAKPFDPASIRLVVRRALEKRALVEENRLLRRRLDEAEEGSSEPLLGTSPAVRRVLEMIERVGRTDATVLILGESGTGKELVARAIHRESARRNRPFLTVDCGALVDTLVESELFGHLKGSFTGAVAARQGRFERAHGGTVFLDEIGNIGPVVQGKLLRVIQEREITRVGGSEAIPVDVRIIAATNQNLAEAIETGRFREDLYYRLSVVQIELPPLRARREDIPLLAEGLLVRLTVRKMLPPKRISPEALRAMQGYDWPGNVRELENKLERAMVLAQGPEILPEDLRLHEAAAGVLPDGGAGGLKLEVLEAQHIRKVLDLTGWRLTRAAFLMGIDRKTLWRKIKIYHLR